MVRGKTIQIYLPNGNPLGARIINIPSFPLKAALIPKNLIKETHEQINLNRKGLYFLFNEKEESGGLSAYIGEGILLNRINNHYRNKDDWSFVVCFYSDSEEGFHKGQIEYLEAYSIKEAKRIGRVDLQNGKEQLMHDFANPDKDLLLSFFDEIKLILGMLRYPIFDEIKKAENQGDIFYCKSKEANATGSLTEEGFVVYKESKANKENTSGIGGWVLNIKNRLILEGILKEVDNYLVFTRDFVFNSPSAAAAVVVGRSANGWTQWKNKEGKTLDELKRQVLA